MTHSTDFNPSYNLSRSATAMSCAGSDEGPEDEGPKESDEKLKPGFQSVRSIFAGLDPLFWGPRSVMARKDSNDEVYVWFMTELHCL